MKKLKNIEVINRVKTLLPTLTIVSKYEGRFVKILVKDEYGILYKVSPDKLFAGKKPSLATAIDKNDGFIKKAQNIHGNKYDYSEIDYKRDNIKVTIICPVHGRFNQLPTNHLSGQGCRYCGIDKMKFNRAKNGFSKTQWTNHCNKRNKIPSLYIIRCFNNNESFLKIGITTYSIKDRFYANRLPYEYEIITEIKGNPDDIYIKEKELHIKMKDFKYIPKIKFCGHTECFRDAHGKGVIT